MVNGQTTFPPLSFKLPPDVLCLVQILVVPWALWTEDNVLSVLGGMLIAPGLSFYLVCIQSILGGVRLGCYYMQRRLL